MIVSNNVIPRATHYYEILMLEQTLLGVANPQAADWPTEGWPPEGRIVMTP
jgi:hypothetical protein